MNWKQRGFKLGSVFTLGYGGGLPITPVNFVYYSQEIDWLMMFIFPLFTGFIAVIPQLGKMLTAVSKETS